jgi:CheY-like chemotaxis protein
MPENQVTLMATILIIEDETHLRRDIGELLGFSGFSTLEAEDGRAGIQLAEAHMPDLILCDITMPGMDGLQVLEHLHANPQTVGIPFVFLTARAEGDLRGMLKRAGASDYLAKPFTLDQLHSVIERNLKPS